MRAKLINPLFEMSIEDIKLEDVVTKKVIDEFQSDSYVVDYLKFTYAQEHGVDESEIDEESEEFKEWFQYEIESMFYETRNRFIYEIIDGNEISIWRQMRVGENWIEHLEKQGKRLGIWWSWDPKAAESHWGYDIKEKPIEVNIESVVNVEHINWVPTIKANMHPSYQEEKEIQLFKNTPLKIVAIYDKTGKEIDILKIKNKMFKA